MKKKKRKKNLYFCLKRFKWQQVNFNNKIKENMKRTQKTGKELMNNMFYAYMNEVNKKKCATNLFS